MSDADQITVQVTDPRDADALWCLSEYYAELNRRFEGGFQVELSCDPEAADMLAPRGAFLVAYRQGPVGCVGIKGNAGYAEIKRLWIAPEARGAGLAARLMAEAEARAKALGITLLRLDTNSALPEAARLYHRLGWREIDRFNDDPYPDHFFEKSIG